jgi:poly-gamma-glutamate capsule biosynthesis protein CapA/YwtB (metallophosphatase superfamily)
VSAVKSDNCVDIFFLGDTYFGEWHMRLRAKKGKSNVLAEKGYLHFGKNFENLLADGDEVIVNLECAITNIKKSPLANTQKVHLYSAREAETISALKAVGTSAALLANNHTLDFGKAGLIDTMHALENAGIKYIGGGRNADEAAKPLYFSKNMIKTTFKAAVVSTYNYNRASEAYGFYAEKKSPGTNRQDLRNIRQQVRQIKDIDSSVMFIISPHWGPNYSWRTFTQQKQGEQLVDAGVDLIVGHSAHMLQEVEYYKDKLILYSIGNFLLNGDGEYKRRNLPQYSFIARLNVKENDTTLEKKMMLYPIVTGNLATDFTPRFVNDEEFEHVLLILRGHNYDTRSFDNRAKINIDGHGNYLEFEIN